MTKTTAQIADMAIHCTASTGETGCFLFSGDSVREQPPVSPVFNSLVELFAWCQNNGWQSQTSELMSLYIRY